MKTTIGLDVFRRNLASLVVDTQSWQQTVKANPAMACLSNGSQCQPNVASNFKILDAAGNTYYDSTSPSNGLTSSGGACSTFSPANANGFQGTMASNTCPYRMTATWRANCNPPNCAYPQVIISLQLISSDSLVNPANYSTPNIYRSAM